MGAVAELILAVHLAVVGFNLFGLVVVPLGAWRGWGFVHAPLWRLFHVGSLAVTAVQAIMGRACFLTLWQAGSSEGQGAPPPMIMHWVNAAIYWPLPLWVFTLLYCLAFAYALALLRLVPLRR